MSEKTSARDKTVFKLLQFLRICFALAAISFISNTGDLGTSQTSLSLACVLGILLAGYLLQKKVSLQKVVFLHIALLALFYLSTASAEYFSASLWPQDSSGEKDLFFFRLSNHARLLFFCYAAGFLSSWFFWYSRLAVTSETLASAAVFIWLLQGHRNYQLDSPKIINAIAWNYKLAPQHLLIAVAVGFAVLIFGYLCLANARTLLGQEREVKHRGRANKVSLIFNSLLLLLLLASWATYVNRSYSANLSRASNGVGQEGESGKSPLGFHSAVGSTKQPAALVRLEGDYKENPWRPMIYFREGALSEYSGREFVVAPAGLDRDVPRIAPGQAYLAPKIEDRGNRRKVTQSVYLLTKHKSPFALDYPLQLRGIKNPDPERFEFAYQALSLAPTLDIGLLIGERAGNPAWDKKTLAHYTRAPGSGEELSEDTLAKGLKNPLLSETGEDLRYAILSQKLTAAHLAPVEKAAAIVKYLSEASIYTRKPGHRISPEGDPVAPYLFSEEKKGYCVHFSHAAVYMMRLAGIPARIATGYMADLNYAKDGHILLHLGDRHAWPEIYVENHGWVVLDVTPSRAENEQEIIPDEKLLEELMSKIDPAEELLEPLPEMTDVAGGEEAGAGKSLDPMLVLYFASFALIAFLSAKIWLRQGYRLASGNLRIKRAYASFASQMTDLGLGRESGETRREFSRRLEQTLGVDSQRLTQLNERNTYAPRTDSDSSAELETALEEVENSQGKKTSRVKRMLAFFNPASLARYGRW